MVAAGQKSLWVSKLFLGAPAGPTPSPLSPTGSLNAEADPTLAQTFKCAHTIRQAPSPKVPAAPIVEAPKSATPGLPKQACLSPSGFCKGGAGRPWVWQRRDLRKFKEFKEI